MFTHDIFLKGFQELLLAKSPVRQNYHRKILPHCLFFWLHFLLWTHTYLPQQELFLGFSTRNFDNSLLHFLKGSIQKDIERLLSGFHGLLGESKKSFHNLSYQLWCECAPHRPFSRETNGVAMFVDPKIDKHDIGRLFVVRMKKIDWFCPTIFEMFLKRTNVVSSLKVVIEVWHLWMVLWKA